VAVPFSTILLLVLAVVGLANAVYFALIYYRLVKPDSTMMPPFCRLGEETCEAVVFTRYGRLLHVPNSLLGIFFYLLLVGVALSKLMTGRTALLNYALAASAVSVVIGVYLTWALLIKLKAP
jgi:uncharacterized membrane protein